MMNEFLAVWISVNRRSRASQRTRRKNSESAGSSMNSNSKSHLALGGFWFHFLYDLRFAFHKEFRKSQNSRPLDNELSTGIHPSLGSVVWRIPAHCRQVSIFGPSSRITLLMIQTLSRADQRLDVQMSQALVFLPVVMGLR